MGERHQRMTELFGRAVALDAAARAQLIDDLARDDRELAAELRSLLAADEVAGALLGTGGLAPEATAPAAVGTRPDAIEIPGYLVEGVLGEGAMGIVLAAEQRSPRRPVAIKVMRSRNAAVLERFAAEAEIMARLDHPGIARVYAAGEAAGAPYLVMERVQGVTLDEHVARERPSIADRLALFASVCDAIHHAHVKGVVHRDLKPSNIMVRDDGRVALLDFGIARLLDADQSRTREGELIGTPVYMSPEQARMHPDEIDTRSDVYALGVILYELLSGELPYPVRGRPLPALVRAICEDDPRPLTGPLRGDLDAIARRALAKSPDDRYPSAAALGDDLRRFLAGRSVSARAPGAIEEVWRYARRHPRVAGSIAAAIVGTAAATAIITSLWLDARAAHRAALSSRDALELRANELTLARAQTALARDPAAALADLASLSDRGVDPWQVGVIASHARGLGSATRVLRAQRAETRWVERVAGARMIVTASYDGAVRSWSDDGGDPRVLWRTEGRIHAARPSPDGALLAIGADGGAAAVVDLRSGAVRPLVAHAHDVERIEWSRDGRWLVTADDHGGAHLWWNGGANGVGLDGPTASIQALGTCDAGACAYAGDDHGRVTLWSTAAAAGPIAPDASVEAGPSAVLGAWASEDAIAAATEDGTVTTWRRAGGAFELAQVVHTGGPIHDAAFAPGGAFAVLGRVDGGVLLVEGGRVTELGRFADLVRTVAVSPDGAWMGAGGDGGELAVWTRAGRRIELRGHTARIRHLSFDRGALLTSDGEGVVRAWDLAAIPPTVWLGKGIAIEHVLATGDGGAIAIDTAGELRALSADGGTRVLGEHGHRVRVAALVGDELVTASGSDVVLWAAGAEPHRAKLASAVNALAVAPGGARLAVATAGGPIDVLDAGGAIVTVLPGDEGGTNAIAFDPSGALLASGGQDRAVHVWRLDALAREIARLPGPTGDTRNLAFASDGATLYAGGDDGVVRAWAVRNGAIDPRSLREVARHTGAVIALAISPSGRTLASIGRDGRVLRVSFDARTGARVDRGERAIASTPTSVIADDERITVIDSDGALWRWTRDASSFHPVPIDATALAPAPGGRLLVGLRDGEVVTLEPK